MTEEASQYLKLLQSIYLFKKSSEDQMKLVIEGSSIVIFDKETLIFSQDKPASDFYIVLTGSVELHQIKKDKLKKLGVLSAGDVFGFEMLEYDNKCLSTAIAKEKTRLLVIDRSQMKLLLQNITTLNQDLKILYESYLLNLQTPLSWKNDEEVVYFIARRHWMHLLLRFTATRRLCSDLFTGACFYGFFSVFPGMATPLILLGADFLLVFGLFVWLLADWSNDYSILTNQRVLFQEKVILLYDSRQESPLNAILSVSSTTDYFGRLLSYGDVVVRTYAGSIELPRVSHPRQVAALIETVLARVKIGQIQTEKEQVEELIRNKLGGKPEQEAPQAARPVTPQVKSNAIFSRLNEMFRLKLEKGEITIYRKHWFILLGKIWLPSLLLLGLLGLTIFRLLNHLTFLSINAFFGLIILTGLMIGGWWIYNFIDWQNDQFVVTPEQLVDVGQKTSWQRRKTGGSS